MLIFCCHFIDVWASDLSYTTKFREWVKNRMFYPVEGVGVSVFETSVQAPTLPSTQCSRCNERWEGSGVLEELKAVKDWSDPSSVVSFS